MWYLIVSIPDLCNLITFIKMLTGTFLPVFCDESYYVNLGLMYMSTFEDIKMLISTDLPIFCDESCYVSLRLRYVSTFEDIKT